MKCIDISRYLDTTCLHFVGHLSASIIEAMNSYKKINLVTFEGFSCKRNGLYDLLDDLCLYYNWDKKNITITTTNFIESHDKYCIEYLPPESFNSISQYATIKNNNIPWDRSKYYGMFIGRANVTRVSAIYNHNNFKYKHLGLVSFNEDLESYSNNKLMLDYLKETDHCWSEIKKIKQFSDIGDVCTPPITFPHNFLNFENVYKKIALEIVCETSEDSLEFSITEKLIRPMMYKRPFLLIASSNFIKNAKNKKIYKDKLGLSEPFDFYENLIPNYSCCYDGASRSSFVFDRLGELIENNIFDNILEKCQDQLEHNYKLACNFVEKPSYDPEKFGLDANTWGRLR